MASSALRVRTICRVGSLDQITFGFYVVIDCAEFAKAMASFGEALEGEELQIMLSGRNSRAGSYCRVDEK